MLNYLMQSLIDAHIHVWDLETVEYGWLKGNTSVLGRTYSVEELEEVRDAAGVTGGVLVQAANNLEDTDWMLEVAERKDWIKGVVGWLPLTAPGQTAKALEEKYSRNSYFKGVRHLVHDEPDPKWLLQPEVTESLQLLADKGLTYDIVGVLPEHIETALEVAEKIPGLRMVFDHLNQPPMTVKEKFGRWGDLMKEASRHPNFYAKISGLGTAAKKAHWSAEDIKPCLEFIFRQFGAERCFCGGDWPVSLLAGDYTGTWEAYREAIDSLLNGEDRENVYGKNAVLFYNL